MHASWQYDGITKQHCKQNIAAAGSALRSAGTPSAPGVDQRCPAADRCQVAWLATHDAYAHRNVTMIYLGGAVASEHGHEEAHGHGEAAHAHGVAA